MDEGNLQHKKIHRNRLGEKVVSDCIGGVKNDNIFLVNEVNNDMFLGIVRKKCFCVYM